ncbi:hypothetical protein ACWCYZ_43260 [Streptomyces virginiae]|nr:MULTISPECIES: hypothetical protein [Streptomyces]WSC81323.1 hypothetical protein OHA56_36150 [Streptomyces virginiae]
MHPEARHDGYPLGMWLFGRLPGQRRQPWRIPVRVRIARQG